MMELNFAFPAPISWDDTKMMDVLDAYGITLKLYQSSWRTRIHPGVGNLEKMEAQDPRPSHIRMMILFIRGLSQACFLLMQIKQHLCSQGDKIEQ